jgi:protein-tyrosine phosphatase
MRHLARERGVADALLIASAGTSAFHEGESPDRRSVAAAKRRGILVAGSAAQFRGDDWDRFDYVIAMDASNHGDLARRAPTEAHLEKLHLARSFDPGSPPGASVPDPYYGEDGFDEVLDLCEAACRGLLDHIQREHGIGP